MELTANIFVLATATSLLLTYFVTSLMRKNRRLPPGPWGLPILGHLHLLGASPGKKLLEWRKVYGPIVSLKFGNMPAVALSESKLIRQAFSQKQFSGRPSIKFMEILGRKSIVRGDDAGSIEQRKFFHSGLNSKDLKNSAEERIFQEVVPILEKIRITNGAPLDMKGFFQVFIFNVIWGILMSGKECHDDPEMLQMLQNLSSAQELPTKLETIGMFNSWLDYFILGRRRKVIFDGMNYFVKRFNQHKLTWIPGQPRDMTDVFLDKQQENLEGRNIREDAVEYFLGSSFDAFIGGYDTTSVSMEWLCLYLTKFPEIKRKFQQEIDAQIGPTRRPTLSDAPQMKYVQAVINETLRKSSIGPLGLFHRATEDIEFKGYSIQKDTMIVGNLYAANYDEDVWGDPEVFRPERFLDSDGNIVREKEVMVFSTGRRSCIGELLARNHLFLFSVSIFQQFDTEFSGVEPTLEGCNGVVVKPQGFSLKFTNRKGQAGRSSVHELVN